MKRIVIVNGVIAGLIVSSMFLITHPFVEDGTLDMDNSMWLGYTTMVLAFSMIFIGTKTYRDQHLGGVITFWQGFKLGLLITVIASVIYATTWEFYFNLFVPDFMDQYAAAQIKKLTESGVSTAEIEAMREQMKMMGELYKNPIFRFAFTLLEIFPVGLILSIISSALFRKPQFLPKNVNA